MHTRNYTPKSIGWLLPMLICALAFPGCPATSSVRGPSECPRLSPKPALMQSVPSTPYSESVQRELSDLQDAMQRWRQRLTQSD